MIWKLDDKGNPIPLQSTTATSSNTGMVKGYVIGGEFYVETDDMAQAGLFREKFLKEAMPKIRKAFKIPEADTIEKASRIRKGTDDSK